MQNNLQAQPNKEILGFHVSSNLPEISDLKQRTRNVVTVIASIFNMFKSRKLEISGLQLRPRNGVTVIVSGFKMSVTMYLFIVPPKFYFALIYGPWTY